MISINFKKNILLFLLIAFTCKTYAGIVIGGTRVIYGSQKKEVSLSIHNSDSSPFLIQSWLDDNKINLTGNNSVPFIVTPPLFRLNSDATNSLRIVKTANLPNDRESVYWLNIKSIPTSNPDAENELNISVNNRIKLFYRPGNLNANDASIAYKKLTFTRSGNTIYAHNPTAYYVSLSELSVNGVKIYNPGMIDPHGKTSWVLPDKNTSTFNNVNWSAINDYGGTTKIEKQNL